MGPLHHDGTTYNRASGAPAKSLVYCVVYKFVAVAFIIECLSNPLPLADDYFVSQYICGLNTAKLFTHASGSPNS